MSLSLEAAITEFAQTINNVDKTAHELGSVRATILVNFGPSSGSLKRYGFQIDKEGPDNTDSTEKILLFVLRSLTKRIEELEKKDG